MFDLTHPADMIKKIVVFSVFLLLLAACNLMQIGLGDKVDTGSPEVGIDSHGNGEYVGGDITLSGYATDDLGVEKVTVASGSTVYTANLNNEDWSLDLDTTLFPDGDLELTITAADGSGKSAVTTVLLIVDNNPPTVLVSTPTEYGTSADSDSPEFNKGFTLKGETADATRVKGVYISLYKFDGTAVFTEEPANGTSSWYYTFNSEDDSLNGDYYFFVEAEDYSGNRNSYFYHFEDLQNALMSGGTLPSVIDINAADLDGTDLASLTTAQSNLRLGYDPGGAVMGVLFNPDSDLPQFDFVSPPIVESPGNPLEENRFSVPQRFTGYVEDDDLSGIALVELAIFDYETDGPVDINGEALAASDAWISQKGSGLANESGSLTFSGNQWILNAELPEGTFYIKLRAEDAAGASSTSIEVPFTVSASAPSIVINGPDPGDYVGIGQTVTLDVNVSKSDGSAWEGTEVYVDPDGDLSWTDSSALSMAADVSEIGRFTLDITEGVTPGFDFAGDGTYTIRVRAGSDTSAGNATLGITSDINSPVMTVSTPGDGDTLNGTVTIRGTADDVAVSAVYVLLEAGDVASYSSYPADPVADGWTELTGSVYNWSFTVDTTSYSDPGPDVMTLHYFVLDAAGNRGSDGVSDHPEKINFTVDQSSDLPVISITQPTNEGRIGIDSSIIGNITDDDMVDISTLTISLDEGNDGTFSAPVPVSNPPSTNSTNASWSHSLVDVPEGEHAFAISVSDYKSNGDPVKTSTLTYTFIIDGGPPSLAITSPEADSLWNDDVTFSGTTADANGVASMSWSTDGTTWTDVTGFAATTDGTQVDWTFDFPVDSGGSTDKQYTMQVRSVDTSGATSTEYRPFTVDTTPPVLAITQPPESVTVNGDAVTVGGTVSDVNGVSALYYRITPDSATPPTDPGDFTGWASIPVAYTWSFVFSPLAYNASSTAEDYKIWLRAVDNADLLNETVDTEHGLVVTIDQESDRPIISFNDIDKTSVLASDNVLVGATSLAGLIEDDDSIDPGSEIPIEISIDGGAWTDVDMAPTLGAAPKQAITWKHDISDLIEGVHHVKLRARDSETSDDTIFGDAGSYNWDMVENADLTAANTDADKAQGVPFIVNRGAPTIIIDEPANYSYHRDDVVIGGTSSDSNGVKQVEISFDNGLTFLPPDSYSSGGSSASWSFTYDVSVQGSGVISYIVQATDYYDSTSIANGQFSVDTSIPAVTVEEPDASDTVNGTVSFNGTGGDNIALSKVYYSILPKWTDGTHLALTPAPEEPAIDSSGTITSDGGYTLATGNYSWSDSFDTTSSSIFTQGDETYIFRVLSIDSAGNQSAVSATEFIVDQETDRPEIDLSTFSSTGSDLFLNNVMPTSQQIIGTIVDDDSVQTGLLSIKVTNETDDTIVRDYTAVSNPPTTSETWKHTFGTKLPNGQYNLYLRGADENFVDGADDYAADNYYWNEIGPIPFTVDEDLPVTNQDISDGGLLNATFDISGTASDSNGLKSIDISVNSGASENLWSYDAADPFAVSSRSWARNYPVNGTNDGMVEWTVTVTDVFDKTQSYSRKAYVDTHSAHVSINNPSNGSTLNGSVLVEGTSSDGDTAASEVSGVWIWIGNDGNDADGGAVNGSVEIPAAGAADWTLLTRTDSWDYRFVAAPYDGDTWGIYILTQDNFGNYSDPSADSVSITIDESDNLPAITLTTAAGSVLGASDLIEGFVSDDDYIDVSSLQINFNDGNGWTNVVNKPSTDSSYVSFSHPVTDIAAGTDAYDVQVRAGDVGEDFIDNTQDIPAVTTTTTTGTLYVYVDKAVPDFAITQIDNGLTTAAETTNLYINDYIKLTGTSSDDVQVQSVQVKMGDGGYTSYSAAANTGTNFSTWEWEVASGLGLTGDTTISVLVTDYHGRTNEETYQLRVDTSVPEVTFTTESTNPDTYYAEYGTFMGAYNGTYTFKGESTDNVKITKVYYHFDKTSDSTTADPATDWTEATGTYSWSIPYATTTFADSLNTGDFCYLHIIATDGAGNFSATGHLSFLVQQSTDDPIITISQPTADEVMESNPRVLGTVRDDDGLTSIQISLNGGAYGDVDSPAIVSGKSVSFEHSLAGQADGDYAIQVQAADSGALTTTSDPVAFGINKLPPRLILEEIDVVDIYGGADKVYSSSGGTVSLNTTYINGDFTLVFIASDDNGLLDGDGNGISDIEVKINDGAFDSSVVVDSGDGTFNFPIATDSTDLSQGANNITYRVSDSLGKTTEGLVAVILDTVKPVVSFTSPSSMPMSDTLASPPYDTENGVYYDAPNVNGDVTVQGTVIDDSTISDLVITGGINGDMSLANENTSNINWKVVLDTAAIAGNEIARHDGALTPQYSFNTGDTGASSWDGVDDADETWTNIWRYPIEVVATDAAGNTSQSYTDVDSNYVPVSHIGYIDIDPDGDKPELTIVAPSDGASVSGTFLLNGTLQDDDGADYVEVQIDLNHDGDFVDSFDLDGDSLTTGEFEDESVSVVIDASSTSWAKTLTGSYFDFDRITGSDNYITIRVTPYDINGVTSDNPEEITVYVDNVNPEILGLAADGTTETATPTPASGSLLNDTETLRFRFEDDREIAWDGMKISYDGGANFSNIFADEAARDAAYRGTTDPYKYYVELPVDTSSIVSGGNGLLSVQINVADQTNKTNNLSLQYSVDNTLPTGVWDYNSTLTPQAGVYTFYGNETSGGDYLLIGSAEDTGTISGVDKVDVYFVKDNKFYDPSVDNSSSDVSVMAETTLAVANMSGTEVAIPYPTSNYDTYVISIDNRAERGIYDTDPTDGDNDGFQESLRNKGSYDEWYVYFDSEKLPDGPLDIYYVVYDEAGNMSYEQVSAQISNDPPVIGSYDIGGTNYLTSSAINLKMAGTIPVTMNVSDTAPGTIDTAGYKLTIAGKYNIEADGSVGSEAAFTPVEYSVTNGDFSAITGSSATVSIATTDYDSGFWYEMVGGIQDSDGNIVTQTWWLWIANNDNSAPTVTINDFTQENVSGSGHIEEKGNSPDGDDQADLSGNVIITGTAYDDSSVSSVTVEISADGSTWYTLGSAAVVYADDGDATNNVNYTWSYDWDTSDNGTINAVFGVADRDIQIRAYGSDNVTPNPNTTTEGDRTPKTVDIVPYITDISAGYDIGLKSFIKRSSTGKYTLSTDSSVTIEGYNLPGTTADAIEVGTTPAKLTADSASGSDSMTLDDLRDLTESGYLAVKTNGVSSRNNINDNDQSQNDESSQYYPVRHDDRYIALWDLTDTGFSGSDAVMRPVRNTSGVQTGFEWMYVTTNDTLYIDSDKMTTSFSLSGGDFAYNDSGRRLWSFLHNAKWWITNEANTWYGLSEQYYGSIQWSMENGYAYTTGRDEAYNWNVAEQTGRLGLGNMSWQPGTLGQIDRYENVQMKLIGGDGKTSNFVTYYDGNTTEEGINFVSFDTYLTPGDSTGYYVLDNNGTKNDETDDLYATIDRVNPYDTAYAPTGNEAAKGTGIGNPVYSGTTTSARHNIIPGSESSGDYRMATDGDGTVYIVWYDPDTTATADGFSGAGIKLMYNTTPIADSFAGWSDPVPVASNTSNTSYSYLAMEVDPKGNIHLAYQDDETGFLNYTYLEIDTGNNGITSQNNVLVDALFSSGQYNSLSVKDFSASSDGSDYRPLITTFSSAYTGTTTSLRLAYPLAAAKTVGDGADSSTGDFRYDDNDDAIWESIAVPASSAPQSVPTSMGIDYSGTAYTTPRIGYNAGVMEEAVFLDLP